MAGFETLSSWETKPTALVDTSETTCCSVPSGYAGSYYITQIYCTDNAGAARTVTLKARLSGTDYVLVSGGVIPANDALSKEFLPLVLNKGDSIKATGSNGSINVLVTFAKQFRVS